jgi:phage baseplate assembly protein W
MPYTLVNTSNIPLEINPLGISLNFQQSQVFQSISSNSLQALNNLKNLLLTRIGERVAQPTYGSNLLYILFEPNLKDLKDNIKDFITTPVSYWLPYIIINDIIITTNEDNPDLQHEIEIKIEFQVDNFIFNTLTINYESNGTITTT